MAKISAHAVISLSLAANLAVLSASSPAIGIAFSSGSITINNARTEGNASLFAGATIETGASGSRLQMNNGANVQLSSETRGKIFQDRLVLEKGNSKIQALKPFQVDTNVIRVSGSGNSSAQVSIHGQTVQVASLTGTLQVANSSGVFLTNIAPGMSFEFSNANTDNGAGAPQNSTPPSSKPTKAAGSMTSGAKSGTVIAGVFIVGGAVGTATYFGLSGSTTPQSCMSPCSTH